MAKKNEKVISFKGDTKELEESVEQSKEAIDGLQSKADELTNGLASGFTKGLSGVRKMVTGMKTLKGAIIATGVGALVVAIGSLISYMTTTEKGANALKTAMTFLEVVFKNITDLVNPLGEFLVTLFTSPQEALDKLKEKLEPVFNFLQDLNTIVLGALIKGFKNLQIGILNLRSAFNNLIGDQAAVNDSQVRILQLQKEINDINEAQSNSWEDIKETVTDAANAIVDGVTNIIEETKEAIKVADAYATAQQNTRNLIQRLVVENAKLSAEIEEQQKIIDDTTRSYEERSAALDAQNIATEKLAQNIATQAAAEESLLRQQIAITANYEEREELETELAQKVAERIDAEKQLQIVRLDNAQKTREIDREELERQRSIFQTIQDLRLENIQDEEEKRLEQLRIQEERALQELELLRATEEEKQKVKDEFAKMRLKKEEEVEKISADQQIEIAGQALQGIGALLNAFAGQDEKNARKRFAINKALGIADATVNTAAAVVDALAKDATFPGSRFIAAASAGAIGAAQIAAIASTQFQSSGGGGSVSAPSVPTGGGSAPSVPQLDFSFLNQGANQNALQAYVLETDVSNSQQANTLIQDQATL